jgi:hypothetical protein
MKTINMVIWDQMNILRDSKSDNDSYLKLCQECIEFNDIRFRIKNKINKLSDSIIKEQKSYRDSVLSIFINQDVQSDSVFILFVESLSFIYDRLIIYSIFSIIALREHFRNDDSIVFTDHEIRTDVELNENNFKQFLQENSIARKVFQLINGGILL